MGRLERRTTAPCGSDDGTTHSIRHNLCRDRRIRGRILHRGGWVRHYSDVHMTELFADGVVVASDAVMEAHLMTKCMFENKAATQDIWTITLQNAEHGHLQDVVSFKLSDLRAQINKGSFPFRSGMTL